MIYFLVKRATVGGGRYADTKYLQKPCEAEGEGGGIRVTGQKRRGIDSGRTVCEDRRSIDRNKLNATLRQQRSEGIIHFTR